jgi:hypothetical protein
VPSEQIEAKRSQNEVDVQILVVEDVVHCASLLSNRGPRYVHDLHRVVWLRSRQKGWPQESTFVEGTKKIHFRRSIQSDS